MQVDLLDKLALVRNPPSDHHGSQLQHFEQIVDSAFPKFSKAEQSSDFKTWRLCAAVSKKYTNLFLLFEQHNN